MAEQLLTRPIAAFLPPPFPLPSPPHPLSTSCSLQSKGGEKGSLTGRPIARSFVREALAEIHLIESLSPSPPQQRERSRRLVFLSVGRETPATSLIRGSSFLLPIAAEIAAAAIEKAEWLSRRPCRVAILTRRSFSTAQDLSLSGSCSQKRARNYCSACSSFSRQVEAKGNRLQHSRGRTEMKTIVGRRQTWRKVKWHSCRVLGGPNEQPPSHPEAWQSHHFLSQ